MIQSDEMRRFREKVDGWDERTEEKGGKEGRGRERGK